MKKYNFEFYGSKDDFKSILSSFSNNNNQFFCFDNFIVDLQEEKWKFGVSRGSHSGGYWYIPDITEQNGKIIFSGTIQYIGYSPAKTENKELRNSTKILLYLLAYTVFLPITLCTYLYLFILKRFKRHNSVPPEQAMHEKLCDLMENHLKCRRCDLNIENK